MPRPRIFFAALAVLAFLLVGCRGGEDESSAIERIPFDSARALEFARYLSEDIGPRPSGSPAAREAADYIADEFVRARFGVFRLEFEYEADPNRAAVVKVAGKEVPAVTAGGSASGTASGPAADLGTADAPPSAGSLVGKVAVVRRGGNTAFFEKYLAAREAGAVAVVIVNNEPGSLTANLGVRAEVPVVTVEQGDAAAVLAAAASGSVLAVDVPEPQLVAATNVVARSPTAHACVYAMTANFDTLSGSPGADQNAAGVAVMLELAHQFSAMDEQPAVCFIATDAAYARAAGALAYLQRSSSDSWPAAVIEAHAIGRDGDLVFAGERLLLQDAADLAEQLALPARTDTSPGFAFATEPFRAVGIAVLEVSRQSAPQPADDTPDALRANSLEEAGQLAGRLLIQLSATVEP